MRPTASAAPPATSPASTIAEDRPRRHAPTGVTADDRPGRAVMPDHGRSDPFAPVAAPVGKLLTDFLDEQVAALARLDPALERVGRELAGLVGAGGKRLRPAFVYWGYRASGAAHEPEVLRAAGAVELLHTFALVHDDVMDRSPERRGRPALHEALAALHREEGLAGDDRWFGIGGAILGGDLVFVWADRLFDATDLPAEAVDGARRVFSQLRVEVMAGQYLDLRLAGDRTAGEEQARRVALLKSGRYTVTRPLQLGAALAGGGAELGEALASYGDAVGVAFQLRDDVLGLFGDPVATGKGAIEDLREGKRTVLMVRALARAGAAERVELEAHLGDPDLDEAGAARVREIVADTGALSSVEELLAEHRVTALRALEGFPEPARSALAELAHRAVTRDG